MPVAGDMPTVQLVSLGCAKNVVDSEEMLGVLSRDGYAIQANGHGVDVVVVNTCGFIQSAKEESIAAIVEALERKRRGDVRRVVVAGCLAQRYSRELAAELPDVDAFLGAGRMDRISAVVGEPTSGGTPLMAVDATPQHRWVDQGTRVLSTAPWTAYLKISEGCDHECSFCAIPAIRGRHVSKPIDRVLSEAQSLVERGARELNLIAQDSTQYGHDLPGRPGLTTLLRDLAALDDVRWLRLFYCYPSRVTDEVIGAIAGTPKVCQYIDMPLQHSDDEVLRAMRRPPNGTRYLDLVRRFRAASPDVALRTTFIVGFPGETEAQFANLLQFVEEAQFDRLGVFEYSQEDGTPAAGLGGEVSPRIKRQRFDRLMRMQQDISLARNRSWIGRDIEVLVEEVRPSQTVRRSGAGARRRSDPDVAVGRSYRDAPEIDGEVRLRGSGARPGDFVVARITGAHVYDLIGTEMPQAR